MSTAALEVVAALDIVPTLEMAILEVRLMIGPLELVEPHGAVTVLVTVTVTALAAALVTVIVAVGEHT